MTKTYSELRQAILFKAARDMRKVAAELLDDVVDTAELTGTTASWAKTNAANTARLANELEGRGHEQCIATPAAEGHLRRSRDLYSSAIDRFQARILEAGGTLP